jgi:uncharacterized protein (DUF58 family)
VSWRPATLNVSFLTLAGWALFLGVLTGRADLVVVAVPLVAALVAGRWAAAPAALQIHHEVSADRLFETDGVTVTVTLRADGPAPLVELLEPLPPRVRLERGSNHAFFTLRAGEEVRWEFTLRCDGRQRLRLGGPHVRQWGPLGLAAAETRYRAPSPSTRTSRRCGIRRVRSGRRPSPATTCRRRRARASSPETSVPSPPAIRYGT